MRAGGEGGQPDRDDLFERRKELEHAHVSRPGQGRLRSGLGLALSLRFLRTAARHLVTPPRQRTPVRVAAVAPGTMAITWVGHATVMLSTPGVRVITDPCFANSLWGLRRAEAACLHPLDAAEVSLVLISHAHGDHLHRPSLRRLPRTATLVVPPGCAGLVDRLGFEQVMILEPGAEMRFRDLTIAAVAARHDGRRSLLDPRWRGTSSYLIRSPQVSAFFVGDSGYFSGFRDVGTRMRPDVALLPIAGYEPPSLRATHLSPLDALSAFQDLGAQVLVPIGHGAFPLGYEPLSAPLEWLTELAREQGLGDRLAVLTPGDSTLVRR
jgi:L-ascorbate metabolism protein UlaG (beta-lactamase superfamily)